MMTYMVKQTLEDPRIDYTHIKQTLSEASGGIAYSAVYPLEGLPCGGAMIFSYFQYVNNIGEAQHDFMRQYLKLVSTAINDQDDQAT